AIRHWPSAIGRRPARPGRGSGRGGRAGRGRAARRVRAGRRGPPSDLPAGQGRAGAGGGPGGAGGPGRPPRPAGAPGGRRDPPGAGVGAAGFARPNWALYGALPVNAAYRLAMWLHYVVLAAATFAYARRTGIGAWGGAVAAVSFAFCGFQTIHSSHEWAYHTL